MRWRTHYCQLFSYKLGQGLNLVKMPHERILINYAGKCTECRPSFKECLKCIWISLCLNMVFVIDAVKNKLPLQLTLCSTLTTVSGKTKVVSTWLPEIVVISNKWEVCWKKLCSLDATSGPYSMNS